MGISTDAGWSRTGMRITLFRDTWSPHPKVFAFNILLWQCTTHLFQNLRIRHTLSSVFRNTFACFCADAILAAHIKVLFGTWPRCIRSLIVVEEEYRNNKLKCTEKNSCNSLSMNSWFTLCDMSIYMKHIVLTTAGWFFSPGLVSDPSRVLKTNAIQELFQHQIVRPRSSLSQTLPLSGLPFSHIVDQRLHIECCRSHLCVYPSHRRQGYHTYGLYSLPYFNEVGSHTSALSSSMPWMRKT